MFERPNLEAFGEALKDWKLRFLRFVPTDLNDCLGDRAEAFLDAFSFIPGSINREYRSPFDNDSVRCQPFAKLSGGHYLLCDVYHLSFAPLYRLADCLSSPRHKERFNKERDQRLEEDADALFSALVKPSVRLRNYYVPMEGSSDRRECDCLLLRDGILLLIESKASPLRSVAGHRGNVRKIEGDLESSIRYGYKQACSAYTYIRRETDQVVLYESAKASGVALPPIPRSEIHEMFTVVVLDRSFGSVATDLRLWLHVDNEVGFPWAVDRDALEAILVAIDSFEQLIAFLRWRRQVHGTLINEDEAAFVGFFLSHGPALPPKGHSALYLDAVYADVVEAKVLRKRGWPTNDIAMPQSPDWAAMSRAAPKSMSHFDGVLSPVMRGEVAPRSPSPPSMPPMTRRGEE